MTGVQTCALPICFPVTIGGHFGAGKDPVAGGEIGDGDFTEKRGLDFEENGRKVVRLDQVKFRDLVLEEKRREAEKGFRFSKDWRPCGAGGSQAGLFGTRRPSVWSYKGSVKVVSPGGRRMKSVPSVPCGSGWGKSKSRSWKFWRRKE